jgi:hypothetical protein
MGCGSVGKILENGFDFMFDEKTLSGWSTRYRAFKLVVFFPSLNALAMSSCVATYLTLKVRTNLKISMEFSE